MSGEVFSLSTFFPTGVSRYFFKILHITKRKESCQGVMVKMAQTYNFAPITEENGPLAKYEIGETVHKTVRIMSCIYSGNQGFGVYEADENDRRFSCL